MPARTSTACAARRTRRRSSPTRSAAGSSCSPRGSRAPHHPGAGRAVRAARPAASSARAPTPTSCCSTPRPSATDDVRLVEDLPGGTARLFAGSRGVERVFVNGRPIVVGGSDDRRPPRHGAAVGARHPDRAGPRRAPDAPAPPPAAGPRRCASTTSPTRASRRTSRRSATRWRPMAADSASSPTRCSAAAAPRPASTTSATTTSGNGSTCSARALRTEAGLSAGRPCQHLRAARRAAEEPAAGRGPRHAATPRSTTCEIERPDHHLPGCPAPARPTCTTCMSADPALRSLPYWESLEPVLAEHERPAPGEPDPRARADGGRSSSSNAAMPLLQAHARDDRRPRARGDPAPRDRLLDDAVRDDRRRCPLARLLPRHDQTPHYEYLRTRAQGARSGSGAASAGC